MCGTTARFSAFIIAGFLAIGCQRDVEERALIDLREYLNETRKLDVDAIQELCMAAGEPGEEILRSEVSKSSDFDRRICPIIGGLLGCDTNRHIPLAVQEYARKDGGGAHIAKTLEGRLDCESRDIIFELFVKAEGEQLRIAARLAALVADDQRFLEIARQKIKDTTSSFNTRTALVFLIAEVGYWCNNPSVASDFKKIFESYDEGIKKISLYAIVVVPGSEAEQLLIEAAPKVLGVHAKDFLEKKLTIRTAAKNYPLTPAKGWRKGLSAEICNEKSTVGEQELE